MLINFLYNLNQCLYISLFTHVTLSCGVMLLSIVIHISTIVSSGARAFASVLFSNKNTKCISLFLSSLLEGKIDLSINVSSRGDGGVAKGSSLGPSSYLVSARLSLRRAGSTKCQMTNLTRPLPLLPPFF